MSGVYIRGMEMPTDRSRWVVIYPDGKVEYSDKTDEWETLDKAADAIEELSKQFDNMNEANIALYGALPKWIPVSEQIPDEYTTILFITGGGDLRVGYYDGDHKSYCDMTGFRYMCTHWMPAPQPPEEK